MSNHFVIRPSICDAHCTRVYSSEREKKIIMQVAHHITILTVVINYNGRLPGKANAHQRWPPLTQ